MFTSLIHRWLTWKRLAAVGIPACAGAAVAIWGSNHWVESVAAAHCHTQAENLTSLPVGLVLGCSPKIGSLPNLFFDYRMDAAAQLYQSGKVRALIVSGDNGTKEYDEPTYMKEALIQRGVPEKAIYCDYAGFRTLDSVVRAHSIFGQSRFVIVSQRFHNERAVFLARQRGLEAEAFNAKDVPAGSGLKTHLREYLARVQAVLDVTLLGTQPKFDGPRIDITQS